MDLFTFFQSQEKIQLEKKRHVIDIMTSFHYFKLNFFCVDDDTPLIGLDE